MPDPPPGPDRTLAGCPLAADLSRSFFILILIFATVLLVLVLVVAVVGVVVVVMPPDRCIAELPTDVA